MDDDPDGSEDVDGGESDPEMHVSMDDGVEEADGEPIVEIEERGSDPASDLTDDVPSNPEDQPQDYAH